MEEFNKIIKQLKFAFYRNYKQYTEEIQYLFEALELLHQRLEPNLRDNVINHVEVEVIFSIHIMPEPTMWLLQEILNKSIELELYEISGNYKILMFKITQTC